MVKVNKLALSISAALILGTVGSAQAATKTTVQQQQVSDLQAQVAQLQQLVQQLSSQQQQLAGQQNQLSGQQQQQAVQLQQQAIQSLEKPVVAPKEASAKPGWIALADGKTQLKIYGNVRTDVTYDTQGVVNDVYNKTNTVPLNTQTKGAKDSLNASAANARLGVDVTRATEYGQLNAKVEADFMDGTYTNGNGQFRLRHAYVSLGNWLVGQTVSPFVTDTPNTVDPNGIMGAASLKPVQVRYTQPITKNQKLLVALEGNYKDPNTFSGTSQTSGGNRLPSLTAQYAATTADKKASLQAVGFLHENRVAQKDTKQATDLGWGVGIGGKYNLTDNDAILANYYHVVGDSKYMLYKNSDAYFATVKGNSYTIAETKMDAAFAGYTHKWNKQFQSSVLGGAIWYKKDGYNTSTTALQSTSNNKSLYNVLVNTFYTPVKDFDLGAEYTYGQRKTFANQTGDYSRINFMAKYSF